MGHEPQLLRVGLGAGGALIIAYATYILVGALAEQGGMFGFVAFSVPIGVPIAMVSVLLGIGLMYVAIERPDIPMKL